MNELTEPKRMEVIERAESQPAVHPMPSGGRQLTVVEYAMQNGATAADIKALVELQIQMDNHKLAMLKQQDEREREQRKVAAELAFDDAFAAFRGENIIVPKGKRVDRGRAGSFSQAEFDDVCRLLSPALSKHGFSFRHDMRYGTKEWPLPDNPNNVIGWVYVTCHLAHRGGHSIELPLEGPPDEQSANTPVQNMQSTASFLKRQSLLAITGTATGGEDDEGRMRRQPAGEQAAGKDHLQELRDAGRAAAMDGSAALNKWWASLSARGRSDMQGEFGSLRKAATKADQAVTHG